jgi:hypothetical protein
MDVDELLQDHAIRSEDARMKLQDLARRSDEARIRSAGENADMERTYKGVMEILEPHIGQKEIREIIFTLTMYQKPCPSWYQCPPRCACGGFNNPERNTYEETHPNPLLKWEPIPLLVRDSSGQDRHNDKRRRQA